MRRAGDRVDAAEVLRALPHAVLALDAGGGVTYANPAAVHLLEAALPAGQAGLVGTPALHLVVPAHRGRARRLLEELRTAPAAGPLALRLRTREERWVELRATRAEGGGAHLSLTEVTEQTVEGRRLRRSEQRFRAAFESAAHGTCLLGEDQRLLVANDALAELLGRPRESLVGWALDDLLERPGRAGGTAGQGRTVSGRLRHSSGSRVHVQVTTTAVQDEDAGERLTLVQLQDVTERRRSEKRLRHLALHDQLTDLPARNLLLEHLRRALESRTAAAALVAALFVDLDKFKLVNDALGHAVGDLVLRQTALRLRRGTRPEDTVARLSGDEFVVVCPALTDEQEAVAIADRLSDALKEPVTVAGDEVLVSASIGVAFASSGATTAEELLRDADAAMYRAKQLGRRRYEVYDEALRERAEERERLRVLVTSAGEQGRLVVHYQPVVDLLSRRVVGLEALMRVRDDDGRLLEPDDFLAVAAETGSLAALDAALLRTAAPAVAAWSRRTGHPLGLSVNLSPSQLDARLPAAVLGALADAGLPPERLLLEVTERTLTTAGQDAEQWLCALADAGVRLALDDFGTGWGSLTCLRRLPVAVLKVDPSLVAGLPGQREDLTVVRAVVGLATQLGLHATVEGLESEQQYAAVAPTGAPYGQGFLFGGPVPADEVPGVLSALGVQPGAWPPPRGAQPAGLPACS